MLLLASSVCGLFKWRQFEPEVILLAVGWYLRFSLSYRNVEELLAERGLHADHVTVWRWVQRYAPEMERRLHSRLKPTSDSWRVDEIYIIRVKGKRRYLYRAVDSTGRHPRLPSLGQAGRGRGQALSRQSARQSKPSDAASHQHRQACRLPGGDCATQRRGCSGGEPGHQRRIHASQHFRSFWGAWRTIAGYEAIHMIRKRPGVLECGRREGRSAPSLYCWYVWN
jgi:hypothetical protein